MHRSTRCGLACPPILTLFCCVTLGLLPHSAEAQIEVENCYVTLLEDVEVPAEVAGVVLALEAKEGQKVRAGDLLGKIDDRAAQANYKLTEIELQSARDEEGNDVSIRYAKAAEAVAKAELQAARETNKRRPGVIAPAEMRTLELSVTKATLGTEQTQRDKHLLKYAVDANEAKLGVAEYEIQRRQIRSPLDGIIVEVLRRKGEWVNPGDPVLRIVRMDQLRVEGFVNIDQVSREQVADRPIEAKVDLGRGRTATFKGKIIFVDPLIRVRGDYRVRAEVQNKEQAGQWLLRPGHKATLILGELAEVAAAESATGDAKAP